MKIALLQAALALAYFASPTLAAPPTCNGSPLPRKEWRNIPRNQQIAYLKTMNTVVRSDFYAQLSRTHDSHNGYIHGWSLFFPWHRAFLVILEQKLQEVSGNPNFRLAYWDWSYDSQAPEMGPIWGPGEHQIGTGNGCVRDGAFANYVPGYKPNGNTGCLEREFARSGGRRMDPVTSADILNRIISRSSNYDEFRRGIEMSPHGGVHVAIGGDMAYMHSPNDPAFFFHHAMVDKIWADYQKVKGVTTYDGPQGDFNGRSRGRQRTARTTDPLTPYDWTVADAFDTRKLCYYYEDLNINNLVMNDLPEPTVTRPTVVPSRPQPVTAPIEPVVQPSRPTVQPVVQPTRPSVPSNDRPTTRPQPVSVPQEPERRRHRHGDDGESGGTRHKIKKFFKDLFNDGVKDPSQSPLGGVDKAPEPVEVDSKVQFDYVENPAITYTPLLLKTNYEKINREIAAQGEVRSELIKLRAQPLLPVAWLQNNGLNVDEARKYEADHLNTINKLNSLFGYISPSALWNQVDKVIKLTKAEAEHKVEQFSATISKVVVKVENTMNKEVKDAKQAAVDVYARVKASLGLASLQAVEKLSGTLKTLIGEPVYGENVAANPYRPRHVHRSGSSSGSSSSSSSNSSTSN